MGIFRWLHLSDFHFGKDDYDERKLAEKISKKSFLEKRGTLNAIFITGDIAFAGEDKQYDNFKNFLNTVNGCYPDDTPKPKIYVVPGNHDVNRKINKALNVESSYIGATGTHLPCLLDPDKNGLDERKLFIERFEGFRNTLKDSFCFPIENMFGEKGFFADSLTVDGMSIGIAGINTAWLAHDENEKEKITPGKRIVEEAIEALEGNTYKILLGHHPLFWFRSADDDRDAISSLLGDNKVIYMCGHLHQNEVGLHNGRSGSEFLSLGAGAAFLTRITDPKKIHKLRHSVQYGELDENGIRIYPMKWSEVQRGWTTDDSDYFPKHNYVDGTNYWEFPFQGKKKY